MVNEKDLKQYPKHYDGEKLHKLSRSMNKELGDVACIIAMEELAELIQMTSKWLRFGQYYKDDRQDKFNDKIRLTEEIADVYIALDIIKDNAHIQQSDINRMVAYKIDRKQSFLSNGSITGKKKRG